MNWTKKRVLITGGWGMIGTELYEQLIELGANVTVADVKEGKEFDLRYYDNCIRVCDEIDFVFHLVGFTGNPKITKTQPVDFMAPMLQCDINMIQAAQVKNVKRFLYTSSIAVENLETDLYPATAKLTAEKFIEAQKIQYPDGTKYCVVRPANVYGRYADFERKDSMVVTSLINQALTNNEIKMYGEGKQERDFVNSQDVARGMIEALDLMPEFPVNLCSGESVTIKNLIKIISRCTGVEVINIALTNEEVGAERRVMKINWQFKPIIELEDGIQEVVDYVRVSRKE